MSIERFPIQADEDLWISAERDRVNEYLEKQRVEHLGVGEFPAFHIHPYLSLWAVQSKRRPGWVGWWVISGDLPSDYINSESAKHPREALRVFATRWQEVSSFMVRGEVHPDYSIGSPEQWPELGDLLQKRAEILQSYADNDNVWSEKNL